MDSGYALKREEIKAKLDGAAQAALSGNIYPDSWWEELILSVFYFQARFNPLYAKYLELLGLNATNITDSRRIPFLPIELFKTYSIQTGNWEAVQIFTSSGTTGQVPSRHFLRDADWYRVQARHTFQRFYGPLNRYCFLALLPSYLERSGSSLVFMADDFIRQSGHPESGFYLDNTGELHEVLEKCQKKQVPVILLGVSFALLDLAENCPMPLKNTIIMETGGMKGRRAEITREELHQVLKTAFDVHAIHSEYGMTELLSQAYSLGDGVFRPATSMRISIREATDPFALRPVGLAGAINVTDLANLDTLSFIATEDLGRLHEDGSFEVLGRLDQSELRGCNLMVE